MTTTEQSAAAYADPRRTGRPSRDGVTATGHVHLRITLERKSAWVRAAQPRTLAEWITEHLDRVAGYGKENPPRSEG